MLCQYAEANQQTVSEAFLLVNSVNHDFGEFHELLLDLSNLSFNVLKCYIIHH